MGQQMVRVLVIFFCVIVNPVAALAQSGAAKRVDVRKLQEDWRGAMVAANLSALEAVYSDDLIYVHSNGRIENKQQFLSPHRTGNTRYRSITPCDVPQIRAYDHTAIVSSCNELNVESGRTGNAPTSTSNRHQFLTVYVNEGGKWRIVAQQTTRLPEKQ